MNEITWRLDSIDAIGGHRPQVVGAPRIEQTGIGPAVAFDGRSDGLIVPANPLAGAAMFTLEALFRPDAGGEFEQRFVHVQQDGAEDRALLELRVPDEKTWYADTYIRSGTATDQPLNDPALLHALGGWHTLALVFDGRTMRQFVDGAQELTANIDFAPLGPGRVSLGMRINQRSFFRGLIHSVRFSSAALLSSHLMPPRQD